MLKRLFTKKRLKIFIPILILLAVIGLFVTTDTTPAISVKDLSGEKITTSSKKYKLEFNIENYIMGWDVKVFMNNKEVEPVYGASKNYFTQLELQPGDNGIKIYVVDHEESAKTFTIRLKQDEPEAQLSSETPAESETPKTETPSQTPARDDSIFEAEITCQEYAESYFGAKDINIHHDQSSIKRKNPDGSILIKVNIADSQGLLRPEKPLGTMECTTTVDGMRVTKFLVY